MTTAVVAVLGDQVFTVSCFFEKAFAPVPRLQIVTIAQAMQLRDRDVHLPAPRDDTFRRAAKEVDSRAQGALDL